MSTAKLPLTSRQLSDLIITSCFQYWAEPDGKGLVEGVKNVATASVYRQAITEAVHNLRFLGFKVSFLKPARTTHPDKAMAKVSLSPNLYLMHLNLLPLLSLSISSNSFYGRLQFVIVLTFPPSRRSLMMVLACKFYLKPITVILLNPSPLLFKLFVDSSIDITINQPNHHCIIKLLQLVTNLERSWF